MKKLLVALVLLTAAFSCTPDDQCGTVTDWDTDGSNHYLWVDGTKHTVSSGTWYEYEIGDDICIEY